MAKHDLSRIRVNADVVDPLADGDDQPVDNPAVMELRMRFYEPDTNEPIPLEQIERRIRKNAQRMNRLSVEMMFDIYFVHANWTGFYNRTDSFKGWLERSVDMSRSYAYDIIKVVRTMIAYADDAGDDGRPLQIEELGSRIEEIGLKKMKLISQVRDQEARYDFISRALGGESVNDQEILDRSTALIGPSPPARTSKIDTITISAHRIRHLVGECDAELTKLEASLAEAPIPRERDYAERATQRKVLGVLAMVCDGTPLAAEINRIKTRHDSKPKKK